MKETFYVEVAVLINVPRAALICPLIETPVPNPHPSLIRDGLQTGCIAFKSDAG